MSGTTGTFRRAVGGIGKVSETGAGRVQGFGGVRGWRGWFKLVGDAASGVMCSCRMCMVVREILREC